MKVLTLVKKGFEAVKRGAVAVKRGAVAVKDKALGLAVAAGAAMGLTTPAQAAFTAPDLSATVTDMGVAFGAVLTLVVAFIGFKYIKRMFA